MDPLKQLSQVSAYRPDSGHLLNLFDLLVNQQASRDHALTNFQKEGKTTGYFNFLYNKLKGKLLEGVLFYIGNDHAEYNRESFKAMNQWLVCMKLIRSDNKRIGIPESEKLLSKCIQLGMVQLALSLALELEHHFGAIQKDARKYQKYKSLCDELSSEWDKELRLQRLFTEFAYSIKKKRPLKDLLPRIDAIMDGSNSYYRSHLFYFSLKNLWFRIQDDRSGVIDTCREAATYFLKYKYPVPYTTTWNFNRQMIPILVGDGRHAEAEVIAKRCVKLCRPGSYNWHISQIYMALVGFHSNKQKIALKAWQDAMTEPMLFENTMEIKERWLLIRSYLELFEIKVQGEFRLHRFLNSIPTLNSDKRRSNVAVITCKLLHLWKEGRKEKFGDVASQLNTYINQHLNQIGLERPKWFLQVLVQYYNCQYHPARYEPRIRKIWKKIEDRPSAISVNVFETEIIPIEQAWKIINGGLPEG